MGGGVVFWHAHFLWLALSVTKSLAKLGHFPISRLSEVFGLISMFIIHIFFNFFVRRHFPIFRSTFEFLLFICPLIRFLLIKLPFFIFIFKYLYRFFFLQLSFGFVFTYCFILFSRFLLSFIFIFYQRLTYLFLAVSPVGFLFYL